MQITIQRKEEQASGQFNGGEILENKPIGFPQDGGPQVPYSNLFYWAHAWTDVGSLIGKHPHQGFEIMSIVLEGDIVHYDSKNDSWFPLKKGDVQIIRSGSGISHAEQMNKDSQKDDFALISETDLVTVEAAVASRLLLITSPEKLDYKPYLELYRRR